MCDEDIAEVHKGQKALKCDICGKKSLLKRNILNTCKHIHEGQKDFKCDICDKVSTKVREGEKAFKCDICTEKENHTDCARRKEGFQM